MTASNIQRVAILKGGTSGERDISLLTGQVIEDAMQNLPYDVQAFDVDEDNLPLQQLQSFDVVFIALHGPKGEDGRVQATLDEAGIRYTGCDAASSQLAMDKVKAKETFHSWGIPTPMSYPLNNDHTFAELRAMAQDLGYPVVIKPNNEGSSLGISIIREYNGIAKAAHKALRFNHKALMEEFIPGRMLEVGILLRDTLPVIEIKPVNDFYDYESKYESDQTEFILDVVLPDELYNLVQTIALQAHQALGCRDMSRVDIILSENQIPYVLEVNTIPGFTPTSLLPKAAAKLGISLPQLIDKLLCVAAERS